MTMPQMAASIYQAADNAHEAALLSLFLEAGSGFEAEVACQPASPQIRWPRGKASKSHENEKSETKSQTRRPVCQSR
jgi:hypothetical protein